MYHTITQTFNARGGEIKLSIVKKYSKLTGAFITLFRAPRSGKNLNRSLPDMYTSDGTTSTIQLYMEELMTQEPPTQKTNMVEVSKMQHVI